MKLKLACASLLVLSACGTSPDAMQPLQSMKITPDGEQVGLSYKSMSGSGNDVILKDVQLRSRVGPAMKIDVPLGPPEADQPPAPPAPASSSEKTSEIVARADSVTLKGLTMKDGKPTVRDIVFSNIAPTSLPAGATVNVGSVVLEGMNEATGRFVAAAFAQDDAGEPPAFEQWGFSKAGIGAMTLAFAIPQEGGAAGKVNIQLGELSFSDLKDKKIGLARLDGLKGDLDIPGMPPVVGTFDLGRMEIGGINTDRLTSAFAQSWNQRMNPGAPVDYAAMYKDYTSPLDGGVDRVFWDGAKADISGLKFSLNGLNSTIKRNADGVAVGIDFPRTTLKLTADSSGGSMGAMGLMLMAMGGYDSNVVEAYLAGVASFDPAKDITRWDNYNLGVTDAFDVKVSLGVEGLQKALPTLLSAISQIEAAEAAKAGDDDTDEDADADEDQDSGAKDGGLFGNPAMGSLVMGLLPLQLTDIDMSITDQKVVNLILERQAASAGQDVAAFRQDLVTMLAGSAVFMKDAGIDAAIADELSAAASGFMAGPGTLRIQLKPKQPLGVMSAMLMPLTKESLGFEATFTPIAPAAQ